MSFFRDLWSDLVEKRLWPVAVVLVAAMVAAPFVLAGGGSSAPDPAPAPAIPVDSSAAAPGAKADAIPVSLDQAPPQPKPKGSFKDPFAGAAKAAAAAQAPAPGTVAAAPPSSGGSSSSASISKPATPTPPSGSGAPSGSTGTSTTPSTSPASQPAAPHTVLDGVFAGYRVDLHWGQAGTPKAMKDVTRLRRLDTDQGPLLVYLGTRLDGKHALFLLATDAPAAGDGRCMPAAASCQVIEMRSGQSRFFDVAAPDGTITQYELDIDKIAERRAHTKAGALKIRERSSKLGAKVVRDAIAAQRDYVTSFKYRTKLGVIVRNITATKAWLSQATSAEVDAPGR